MEVVATQRRRFGDEDAGELRALIYSAVESFADVPVAVLLRTVRDAYADPGPWEDLRDRLARGALHGSPLHLAQASPPEGRRRELELLLLREIRGADRSGGRATR